MSILEQQCAEPGCINHARNGPICDTCTINKRRRLGLCPNCGSEREKRPVQNSITGKQLKRAGAPVFEMVCKGCGRKQRARAESASTEEAA